jgi:hypothetical protein
MSTEDRKPREFWIINKYSVYHPSVFNYEPDLCSLSDQIIHVREVLDSEQSEIDRLRKQLEVAVDIIKISHCSCEFMKRAGYDSCARCETLQKIHQIGRGK